MPLPNWGQKRFEMNLYFKRFHEIIYKIKTVICVKVEAVLHPSGKQFLYFSRELPNETMTLYAVKTPNGFDIKKRKIIL